MLARRLVPRALPRSSPIIQRRYTSTHFDGPSAAPRSEFKPEFTQEEKIPTWAYITVGSMFAVYALYSVIMPTETSWLTRVLSPTTARKIDEEIANRHLELIEQASRDKHLFLQSPTSRTVPMRFPERFNNHSQLNLQAGHTRGLLMDELEEHYRKENPAK
ncbi:hypothetical protein TWF696_001930 [Orbilia brochopaga]|uniref:Uncharacterized protein n=1 Tax=Orbilia brochopaga TaxID=3140254 RepID=A0AAV9U7U3_9PEZI